MSMNNADTWFKLAFILEDETVVIRGKTITRRDAYDMVEKLKAGKRMSRSLQ